MILIVVYFTFLLLYNMLAYWVVKKSQINKDVLWQWTVHTLPYWLNAVKPILIVIQTFQIIFNGLVVHLIWRVSIQWDNTFYFFFNDIGTYIYTPFWLWFWRVNHFPVRPRFSPLLRRRANLKPIIWFIGLYGKQNY